MPPAGCNIAITPIGKRSASSARRIGWPSWSAALPKIRRNVSMHLSGEEPTREFALSAVIELIARTAIRPGNESYARLNGTRGATTLLKSNVTLEDDSLVLTFKAKGGKAVRKECDAAKLVRAIGILRSVPGKRMFQYRDASGIVRTVSTTHGERVPARDRRHQDFAEGFSHPDGVGRGAGIAVADFAGGERARPQAARCWMQSAPPPTNCPIRRRSAARATCTTPSSRRSRTAFLSASPRP